MNKMFVVRISSVRYFIIRIDMENHGDGGAETIYTFNDDRGLTAFQLVQEARRTKREDMYSLTQVQSLLTDCTPVRKVCE